MGNRLIILPKNACANCDTFNRYVAEGEVDVRCRSCPRRPARASNIKPRPRLIIIPRKKAA